MENAETRICGILSYSVENGRGLAMMAKLKELSNRYYFSGKNSSSSNIQIEISIHYNNLKNINIIQP